MTKEGRGESKRNVRRERIRDGADRGGGGGCGGSKSRVDEWGMKGRGKGEVRKGDERGGEGRGGCSDGRGRGGGERGRWVERGRGGGRRRRKWGGARCEA